MLAVFIAGMIGLYLAAHAFGFAAAQRSYDRLLSGAARAIAETLFLNQTGVELDLPYSAFDILYAAPDDQVFYRVFWSNGEAVTGYNDLPLPLDGFGSPSPAVRRADARFFDATYRDENVRFVIVGGEIRDPSSGNTLWVQVGQTTRARQALTQELVLRSLVPIVIMTALAFCLTWFGIRQALAPLGRLSAELACRNPTDLEPVRAPVPVEVIPMVHALNDFMGRLNTNILALREFVGAAAHQLRTPLAALTAQAQAADRTDPADLNRSLDAIDRNAARLTRLVNQMLSDATMIHRSDVRHAETFDIVQLVEETVRNDLLHHEDSRITFTTSLGSAVLRGDPLMLAEAFRNIIHNAVLHANATMIEVDLQSIAGDYILSISDRGPGIPESDKVKVFERFRRGGASNEGAGLGLAIARQAVRAHDGSIMLVDREGGGLTVQLRFGERGV